MSGEGSSRICAPAYTAASSLQQLNSSGLTSPNHATCKLGSIGFLNRIKLQCFKLHCLKPEIPRQRGELNTQDDSVEPLMGRRNPFSGFFESCRNVFKADELGREIAAVALPALLGLAADPIASLVDTAFIGQLGSVELAAVGVSISVFNLTSKTFNIPLLNITTSYVAEDNASKTPSQEEIPLICSVEDGEQERQSSSRRRVLPSASSALILGSALGLIEAVVLLSGAWPILRLMGISEDSPMRIPAERYLALRALGAPAVVVSLATQGVFRGFKDTQTPLYATVTGNVVNIVLVPILMFSLGYGVSGAAVATVISNYIIAFLLLWKLNKLVILVPPNISDLGLERFFKSGGLMFTRTMAILLTMTLATSMAAHQGVVPTAAHQICMQIWLASSLLSDSLALAGQAIIADSLAKRDKKRVRDTAFRVLQLGTGFGIIMAAILGLGEESFSKLFTNDPAVMQIMTTIVPFVAITQPINSVAFVFDGVFYGGSDFGYAAYSMIVIGILSSVILLVAPPFFGLTGVWMGLTMLMSLRMVSGFLRLGTASGPWHFLAHENLDNDS